MSAQENKTPKSTERHDNLMQELEMLRQDVRTRLKEQEDMYNMYGDPRILRMIESLKKYEQKFSSDLWEQEAGYKRKEIEAYYRWRDKGLLPFAQATCPPDNIEE